MKNVTYVGLCWAMCFSLVAVALGQQPFGAATTPPAGQPAVGQPAAQAQGGLFGGGGQQLGQPAMPAPGAPIERSQLTGTYSPDRAATSDTQPRGELGVWLVESGGPGVAIQRVTRGSAAEQAGLRVGDVILQVNGKGAASPQSAAQLIRQIPIGQRGTLSIWRDGDQHQLPVTMQAAREKLRELARDVMDDSYNVGFRGDDEPRGGESSSRIARLEQKITALTQQLNTMQQELTALRSQHNSTQPASYNENAQGATSPAASSGPLPPATSPSAPPPGFGATEEKAATDTAEPKAATPPASEPPAATPPPATEPPATDPFGAASPAPADQPKADEPKAEEKKADESKDATDDLFK